jgi:hypothetical protein
MREPKRGSGYDPKETPLKDLDAKWAANDEAAINFLKMVYNSFKRS